jgi:CheY-like chemotaxis protein
MTPRREPYVLIAEDEPDLRATLVDFVASEGYRVAEVAHGQAALEWLRAHPPPALVIVDLAMPVLNGLRFREEQLADPGLADIPTIALTASRTTHARLARSRFDDVLHKPIDVQALLAVLSRHVPR